MPGPVVKRLLLPLLALLAGCSTSSGRFALRPSVTPSSGLRGSLHGGQQPVAGASLQLYAVGSTGDGSASTLISNIAVTTTQDGSFDLTGTYTCPSSTTFIYLLATGGNPGLPPPATNPNSAFLVALGQCGNPTNITFINVNEVTTVAAVYALAPFMTLTTAIGSTTADTQALADAFALAWEFASVTTGTTPGTNVPSGTTVPSAQINTLANLISACVNSSGGTSGDTSLCGQLFALTTPSGGFTAPSNTVSALRYLALNPGLNTAALYALIPAAAPFQPTIAQQPPDFGVRLSVPSDFTLSSSSLNFGSVLISASSPAQTVTISNNTTHAFSISAVNLSGDDPGDFAVAPLTIAACQTPLYPGSVCSITTTFTPTAPGARHAFLTIKNGSPNPLLSVSLSGAGSVGTASQVSVSPSALNFSLYNVPQPVTLTNSGNTALNIFSVGFDISNNGAFSQTNDCGALLQPQSICTINVIVTEFTTGSTLLIADDASTAPQTVGLTLTSSGFFPPSLIDMGRESLGTTGVVNFRVATEMIGSSASFNLTGADASEFSFDPSTHITNAYCRYDKISFNCSTTLYFTPSALGSRTAEIDVPGVGVIPVTATGVGSGPYFVVGPDLTQQNIVLGSAYTLTALPGTSASVTFPVRYTGYIPLSVNAPVVSGPHASEFTPTTTCTPGGVQTTCQIALTWTPTTAESFTAPLTISDSTNTVQQTIAITVAAQATAPVTFSNALVFPPTLAGTISAPVSTTVDAATNNPVRITIAGPYQVVQGLPCTATPCQIGVVFAPPANSPDGTLTGYVSAGDYDTGFVSSLNLSAIVTTQTTVSVSPGSLSFASRSVGSTSIAQTVTISNTGTTQALTGLTPTIIGADPGDYILTNGCTAPVFPGNHCTMNISFSPAFSGPRTATLNIVSNSTSTPDQVTLSGTAQ